MTTIKTGLLAYGVSGKLFHAPFINHHDGYELIGAWERSTKNITNDYPNTKSFDTLEELLNSDADLIVVNTPINTHFQFAKQVLEAGKHALVEKAFTTTSKEAEELHKLAAKKNLKLCVYQNRRYDSDFRTVKKVIEEKYLGDIVEAEIRFERYNPELSKKVWKEKDNLGTGILMDLGSHIIDQALQLFGLPTKIFADIRINRENSKIDDYFDILLYYSDKRVRLKASLFVKEPTPAYVLHGKKGSFIKHRGDIQEDDLKLGKMPYLNSWGKEPIEKNGHLVTNLLNTKHPTYQGNYKDLYNELQDALTNNTNVPVSAMQAYNTIKIIEAARESSQKQIVISLDLKQ